MKRPHQNRVADDCPLSIPNVKPQYRASYILIFTLALVVRLLYVASIPHEAFLESIDAKGYHVLAQNVGAGKGFALDDSPPYTPDGVRTPSYTLFAAGIYAISGFVKDDPQPLPTNVVIAQAILDSFTAILVGGIVMGLLGRRAAFAAAMLYALTPVQWRYTAALLPEVHLAFLVALSLWLLTRLTTEQTPRPHHESNSVSLDLTSRKQRLVSSPRRVASTSVACGAAAGLAALTKPNLALLASVLAGAAYWSLRTERRRALSSATAIIFVAALVVSPWVIRNWTIFGRPLLSNAGLGFVARVAAPATLGIVEGDQVPPWSPGWEARYHAIVTQAAQRHGWSLEETEPQSPYTIDEHERQIASEAWNILLTNPLEALHAQLVGFMRSWGPLEQTFWYSHLSGRPWEWTDVPPNSYRDAIEILFAGRPAEAFDVALVQPWNRLDAFGRVLWYGWGLGHLLGLALMTFGGWRLRDRPALALAFGVIVAYATFPPGSIGYVRFRVPVMPVITVLEIAGMAFFLEKLRPHMTRYTVLPRLSSPPLLFTRR